MVDSFATTMMHYLSSPLQSLQGLQGDLKIPGDKSISHRALLLSAIAEGDSEIQDVLLGADNVATLEAIKSLGVSVQALGATHLKIQGVGLHGLKPSSRPLDFANSGTGLRIMVGLLAGQDFDSQLIGDASLSQRPMARIVNPLIEMGAKIKMSEQGTLPLKIFGKQTLHGMDYKMPLASAQVKSCLLLAGLYAKGKTCVSEPGITRDHTERLLKAFGCPVKRTHSQVCINGDAHLKATHIIVPGDISSAAFFMVAASIIPGSDIVLKRVGVNPTRIGIITLLKLMGANIELLNQDEQSGEPIADIRIRYAKLHGIDIPIEQVPLAIDEFPVIFIAAACAKGRTVLKGAEELRVKETDRIAVMAAGLKSLGIQLEILTDGLIIEGGQLTGGEVDSCGDHRVAMAFAVAGARAEGSVKVFNCVNVATSFPGFVTAACGLGMAVKEIASS